MTQPLDLVVGGLYATRPAGGTYRISQVLAATEAVVELACFPGRFVELPSLANLAELATADGDSDVRYALLTVAGFWEHEPVLIGTAPLATRAPTD
jgi:hypothetical protein